MFCRNCGTQCEDTAINCPNCGYNFITKEMPTEADNQAYDAGAYKTPEETIQTASGDAVLEAAANASQQNAEAVPEAKQNQLEEIKKRRDKKRKQKKIKKIALIALLVAICTGAIATAIYYSKKQDKKLSSSTNNATVESTKKVTKTQTLTPTPKPTSLPLALPNIDLEGGNATLEVNPSATPGTTTTPGTGTVKTPGTNTGKTNSNNIPNTSTGSNSTSTSAGKATVKPKPARTANTTVKTPTPARTQSPAKPQTPVKSTAPAKTKAPVVATPTPAPKPAAPQKIDTSLVTINWSAADEHGGYVSATTRDGEMIYIQGMTGAGNSYAVVSAVDSGYKAKDNSRIFNVKNTVAINSDEFMIPDSEFRLLTEADVEGMTADELKIARNEIYARHGRKFKDNSLNEYFLTKSWYGPNASYNYSNDAANISEIEGKNAHFLLTVEKALRGE